MQIDHYYHIYADGCWRAPVYEHIEALKKSGLLFEAEFKFYLGIIGSEVNKNLVLEFLDQKHISYHLAAYHKSGWEQETLKVIKLREIEGELNEKLIFYAHTKGAFNPSKLNKAWRKSMTICNVLRWKDAYIALTKGGFDAYGCHWITYSSEEKIFGGNYWWIQGKHISKLDMPKTENRWDAEKWLSSLNRKIKDFKVYDAAPGFPDYPHFIDPPLYYKIRNWIKPFLLVKK